MIATIRTASRKKRQLWFIETEGQPVNLAVYYSRQEAVDAASALGYTVK